MTLYIFINKPKYVCFHLNFKGIVRVQIEGGTCLCSNM